MINIYTPNPIPVQALFFDDNNVDEVEEFIGKDICFHEKDKDGKGQSADAAKGKIQRVGAAKAVADMIQKHEEAGEDPQRKRRHESTSGKVLPKL